MMKIWIAYLMSLCLTGFIFPQQSVTRLDSLKKDFENFKYIKVIADADSILKRDNNISKKNLLEIYRMKGVSQFSLQGKGKAQKSFIELLKIDSTYSLDSSTTSPKIIDFFNTIKIDFDQVLEKRRQLGLGKTDTVYISKPVSGLEGPENLKQSIIRSAILPGWGQFYNGDKKKGIIIFTIGAISLSSMIYFIIESNVRENKYLNATSLSDITSKYDAYNSSYRLRNISIITFAAVWLYSQLDLIFFHEPKTSLKTSTQTVPSVSYDPAKGIKINFLINF